MIEKVKYKISIIAPNSDIACLGHKVAKEFGDFVDVYEGNLIQGVQAARKVLMPTLFGGHLITVSGGCHGTPSKVASRLDIFA
ncbi:MAG: hypothetical protein JG781_2090, partial [Peptococcaceae bacterium]|nr:hypothetical protein [Peptococcaceae bacterium]